MKTKMLMVQWHHLKPWLFEFIDNKETRRARISSRAALMLEESGIKTIRLYQDSAFVFQEPSYEERCEVAREGGCPLPKE